MSIYERYSDKTKCIYFMIKDEKKLDSELIYNKKHLKTEKRFDTKESFYCFYIPVICLI